MSPPEPCPTPSSPAWVHEGIVAFRDADPAGIVHFTRFWCYVEDAEWEFFRHQGWELGTGGDGRFQGWPRVSCQIQYRAPLHVGERYRVSLHPTPKGESRIVYGFTIHRLGSADPVLAAHGEMTVTHASRASSGHRIVPQPIPQPVAEFLRSRATSSS